MRLSVRHTAREGTTTTIIMTGDTVITAPPRMLVEPLGNTCGDCIRYSAPHTCTLGKHPKPDVVTPSCKRWAPKDPDAVVEMTMKEEMKASTAQINEMLQASRKGWTSTNGVSDADRQTPAYRHGIAAARLHIADFCQRFGIDLERIIAEAIQRVPPWPQPIDDGLAIAVGAHHWLCDAGIVRLARADVLGVSIQQCDTLGRYGSRIRAFAMRPEFFHGISPDKTMNRHNRPKTPVVTVHAEKPARKQAHPRAKKGKQRAPLHRKKYRPESDSR